MVAEATGMTFVFDGLSDEQAAPEQDRAPYQPERYDPARFAPVLVSWAPLKGTLTQQFHIDGVARVEPPLEVEGNLVIVTGDVMMNSRTKKTRYLQYLLAHEIGHLVGLDHYDNPRQIMAPDRYSGNARWGKGDLEGLRRVGRAAGCLPSIRPQNASPDS